MKKEDLMLYLVTDREIAQNRLEGYVQVAVENGVTMVQLREKQASYEEFCQKAKVMKEICDKQGVPLIINDNIEVCLAVGASGVHLGTSDCDIEAARKMLGADKIIGASARDISTAQKACAQGADYLGVGAVFGTSTKKDAKTISPQILREIVQSVNIPVVAIGGINLQNILQLKGLGIAGVAVVSGILAQKDIKQTTKKFVKILTEF